MDASTWRPASSLCSGAQHQRRLHQRLRKTDVLESRGLQLPERQEHWRPAPGQRISDWRRLSPLQEFQYPAGRYRGQPYRKTHESGRLYLAGVRASAAQRVIEAILPGFDRSVRPNVAPDTSRQAHRTRSSLTLRRRDLRGRKLNRRRGRSCLRRSDVCRVSRFAECNGKVHGNATSKRFDQAAGGVACRLR